MVTIHEGEPEGWVEKFKTGSLHVVCVASGGLTTCDFAASTVGGMRQEQEVWPLTKRVNRVGETGTFWPRFPLTVLPQTAWEERAFPEDICAFLRKCFEDVAEANRLHIRLPTLFIDLNPYGGRFEYTVALPIAKEVLSQEESILNIWFAPRAT